MSDAVQNEAGKTTVYGKAVHGGVRLEESHFLCISGVLLLALAYLSVSGCLTAPLMEYGDKAAVRLTENPMLGPEASVFDAFSTSQFPHQRYAPLTVISYRLNYAVFGREAVWSFRLVNCVLHALGGLALLYMLMQLGIRRLEALVIALAWTGHPLACESVAWVAARDNVLAFVFGMAGLAAYIKWQCEWPGFLAGMGGLLLALLSGPAGLGFIPIFVAFDVLGGTDRLCGTTHRSDVTNTAGMGFRLLPIPIFLLVFVPLTIKAERLMRVPAPGDSWLGAALTDVEVFARYLAKIVLPLNLSACYHVADIDSFGDTRLYLSLAILVAAVALSVFLGRSRLRVIFGWIWFFGGLLGHYNFMPLAPLMRDGFVYVAIGGVLLVLVELVMGLGGRLSGANASNDRGGLGPAPGLLTPLAVIGFLFVGFLAVQTMLRSRLWADNGYSLFYDAAEHEPSSALAHFWFAQAATQAAHELRKKKKEKDALEQERIVVEQLTKGLECPDAYRVYDQLGLRQTLANHALKIGDRSKARATLKDFLPPKPYSDKPYSEGADAGLTDEEQKVGMRAMQMDGYSRPYYYWTHQLSACYLIMAEVELDDFLDPARPASSTLLTHAEQWAAKALEIHPNNVKAYQMRAAVEVARAAMSALPEQALPEERVNAARELLKRALPKLPLFLPTEQEAEGVERSVPAGRVKAMGLLALADADLDEAEALENQKKYVEAGQAAQKSFDGATKALEVDETCSDAHFVLGHVHQILQRIADKTGDNTLAWQHFRAAKKHYDLIRPTGNRYARVKSFIERLTTPKKPEPEKSKEGPKPETKTEPEQPQEVKTEEAKTAVNTEEQKTAPAKTEEIKTEPVK